jgi:hypothetical protein
MKSEPYRLDCVIRAPQQGNFAQMAELAQLGYPCAPRQIESRLSGMQDRKQYAVYVAILAEGEIAGWIGAYVFRSVELDSSAENQRPWLRSVDCYVSTGRAQSICSARRQLARAAVFRSPAWVLLSWLFCGCTRAGTSSPLSRGKRFAAFFKGRRYHVASTGYEYAAKRAEPQEAK